MKNIKYPIPKKMNCPITKDITKKKSKYNNEKVVIDGITFDSKKEGNRYKELKLMEKSGTIHNLKLQVPFVLIPSFKKNNRVIRETKYIADFTYEKDNTKIVEDVKSKATKTRLYELKKKLLLYKYDIEIKEV